MSQADWAEQLKSSKYDLVSKLGRGNYGITMLLRKRATGELVAGKFIERGGMVNVNVDREILNHRLLVHPHIIRFHEVFVTRTHLVTVMEYATGGELFEYVRRSGRLSEDAARFFFQQLISGVDYCHQAAVYHRDLKLENALINISAGSAPYLKIADFGFSKHAVNDSQPKSAKGTVEYLAPEVVLCSYKKNYDGRMSDVWSCGVILYLMLVGTYPFEDASDPTMGVHRIVKAIYSFPADVQLSDDCKDLITRIFVPDPNQRITLQDIKQHPWFLMKLPKELQGDSFGFIPGTVVQHLQTNDEVHAVLAAAKAVVP